MLKFTAKDLIKRARQLADLENSDFISWNENINLLNESYSRVYQQAIDKGEKFYVVSVDIETAGGSAERPVYIKLPDDFFQLESLQSRFNNYPVQRKTANQPAADVCYDIEGDMLAIYGTVTQGLRLRYYPIPRTITYPAENVPANMGDYDLTNQFDLYGENLVITEAAGITVFNGKTGKITEGTISTFALAVIAGKNCIAVKLANNTWELYSWTLTALSYSGAISCIILDSDKNILVADTTAHTVTNPRTLEVVRTLPEDSDMEMGAIDDDGVLYFYYGGNIFAQDAEGAAVYEFYNETQLLDMRYMIAKDGICYVLKSTHNLAKIDALHLEYLDGDYYAINKLDENTGYGFTLFDVEEGFCFASWVDNTEIDYPSNLFMQIIAYTLAMAYKAKQNADATALAALYDEALTQYYDTLSRDAFSPVRIQNVMR